MIRKDIKEVIKINSEKYKVVVYCTECGKTEEQEVNEGANVYCTRCGNFIMDGMDWEDVQSSENDDF